MGCALLRALHVLRGCLPVLRKGGVNILGVLGLGFRNRASLAEFWGVKFRGSGSFVDLVRKNVSTIQFFGD